MKYIVILGDGMADEPAGALGGLTPLQAAHKPYMDKLARLGRSGMLHTIPPGYTPGSEIANLSVLGYDIPEVYEGRGSLEAASMGIPVEAGEMAMRCNLITIEEGIIKNHSAGHIPTAEGRGLVEFLQSELGGEKHAYKGLQADFFPGVSYRHVVKVKNGRKELECAAPHDELGTPFDKVMVSAASPQAEETAAFLNRLTLRSQELLKGHPVNLKRIAEGKEPADSIWMWSPGYRPQMEALAVKYGLVSGVVISAVDLIKGIGVYAGLKVVEVEGATGLYDTNYEGKAAAAIEALKSNDFVFLHVEASDEAGHEGDVELKVRTIEDLDSRVIGPVFEWVSGCDEPVAIAVLPDHPTPCVIRTHTADPVPFVIYVPGCDPDGVGVYDEFAARDGGYGVLHGDEFMKILMSIK